MSFPPCSSLPFSISLLLPDLSAAFLLCHSLLASLTLTSQPLPLAWAPILFPVHLLTDPFPYLTVLTPALGTCLLISLLGHSAVTEG